MKNKKRLAFVAVRRRCRGNRIMRAAGAIGLVGAMFAVDALAQDESAKALLERSAIVVAGKVVRVNASLEPLQEAGERTVVITITRMYAGAEIAGDQKGRAATVILSQPSTVIKAGAEAVFFGNPRFVGKSLTIADEGELFATTASAATADLEVGSQARRDQPLRERIAVASSVFRGKVESERPLAAATERPDELPGGPPSEHDPEWHVASVRVVTALKDGEQGGLVSVIFPASRDIMWFNAPKLKVGQEAIFIAHKPAEGDVRLMRAPGVAAYLQKQPAVVVSEPLDVMPASDEPRVNAILPRGK